MSATAAGIQRLRAIRRQRRWPPFTLSLTTSIICFALLLPVIYLVIRALGTGADELAELLLRPRTAAIIGRSMALVIIVASVSAVMAVVLGWLIERTDLPFRGVWSVVTALPLVIPSYIMAFLFISVLAPRGMFQEIIGEPLGIERLPSLYGLSGAAIVLILVSYPYTLLTVRAALRGSGHILEDASRTLGKGPWATFFLVTLPQLRGALASGSLLVALYTLSDFGAVSLLRYETFTWAIYLQYTSYFDRSAAAALSLVLIVLALVLFLAQTAARGDHLMEESYQAEAGSAPAPVIPLGRWTYPALGLCSLIGILGLIVPMSVLLYWLVRGVRAGEELSAAWSPAINSVSVSSIAATAALLVALPVIIHAVRFPGRFGALIDRISHFGFALPGIVIALALVFFGIRLAPGLYQTHALIVIAYVILFLPIAMGPLRTSLLQVSPRIEEAGRTLGHGPFRVFHSVTLPLLRPGILAGGALVFLTAMKELPATLLLSPLDFSSLATIIWAASSEAFFARAALPALLLIAISAIPMVFLMGRGRSVAA